MSDGERAGLVDDDLVIGAVQLLDPVGEECQAFAIDRVRRSRLADHADLPQHQGDRYVECPMVEQEVGGFVELQAVPTRINVQIGQQAVDRRHGGEEGRSVALSPRPPDGLVARVVEDGRMAVRHHADVPSLSYALEDALDQFLIDLALIQAGTVDLDHGLRGRVQLVEPRGRRELGEEVEDVVGTLDAATRLGGEVAARSDAGPHDDQRAFVARGRRAHRSGRLRRPQPILMT